MDVFKVWTTFKSLKLEIRPWQKKKKFPKTSSGFCFDSQPQQRGLACISLFTANNETSNNCMWTVPPSVSHLFYFLSLPSCPTLLLFLNYLFFFFICLQQILWYKLYMLFVTNHKDNNNNNFNFNIYLFILLSCFSL